MGTPWHYDVHRTVECKEGIIQIQELPARHDKGVEDARGVKDFSKRRFLKSSRHAGTEVYSVILNTLRFKEGSVGKILDDLKMVEAVHEYSDVFRTAPPDGLPRRPSVNHEIETVPNEKYRIDVCSNYLLNNKGHERINRR